MIKACKSLITATMVLLLFELAQSGVSTLLSRSSRLAGPRSSLIN